MVKPGGERFALEGVRFVPHIVLVDDEPAITRMLQVVLERGMKVQVTAFAGAEAALQFLCGQPQPPVDLLVTDLRMPGMDGLELCRRVRAVPLDIPVIIFSAFVSDDLAEDARALKVYATVRKPVALTQFLDTVRGALGSVE